MLSADEIENLAVRLHTNELNVAREYAQHVFLTHLYADSGSDGLLFKGGTALRIIHQSPRFSEDLDFTAAMPFHTTQALIEKTAARAAREIDSLKLVQSKPTSGGYFGVLQGSVGPWPIELLLQASTRRKSAAGEPSVVATALAPPYNVFGLPEPILVEEKISALLTRAKPRDFYDLYFILRRPMGERKSIVARRPEILKRLAGVDAKSLYTELKAFLPRSHWAIIQRLPDQLRRELSRL